MKDETRTILNGMSLTELQTSCHTMDTDFHSMSLLLPKLFLIFSSLRCVWLLSEEMHAAREKIQDEIVFYINQRGKQKVFPSFCSHLREIRRCGRITLAPPRRIFGNGHKRSWDLRPDEFCSNDTLVPS